MALSYLAKHRTERLEPSCTILKDFVDQGEFRVWSGMLCHRQALLLRGLFSSHKLHVFYFISRKMGENGFRIGFCGSSLSVLKWYLSIDRERAESRQARYISINRILAFSIAKSDRCVKF